MTSQEAGSEISPKELEREALKKRLEKITSWSFDHSSATPRPAEPTRIDAQNFVDTHTDILDAIHLHGYDLFDMLPDKDAFLNNPRYFTGGEDRVITHEGELYLVEHILTIIEKHGLLDGVDQNHPGFAATVETFLPADNQRATLDAITALQLVAHGSAGTRLKELYKPESRSYITSKAVGESRRMVRTGYTPRKDGITFADRYTSVFGVNRTNTVTIEGKPVTYDQVDATLLGKLLDFYEQFDNINNSLEVTPEIIARLQNYIGLKINAPEFWNVRNDDDKSELQVLLTEFKEASDDTVKKQLFSQIIKRIFSNVDLSPNIGAMGSNGDMLAAGMPVQARLQEWGRIVFGNEAHTADGETPAFSKEASIDMRSAQALFNMLIPPERLKDLYIIDHEIATLRKPYDDEIQKVNEATLDEATRKKELEDIYKRMNRDQQLSEKIVTKTDMRAMYYDAILEAYNVEEPEGFKTADGGDQQLIDQIRERKALLKGKTWSNVNTESETELLKLFSDTDSDENAIRARIKTDRKRTRGALLRLEERFGQNFIKNNRAGNDVVIGMGLKGIELLKRRAQSHRMRNTETVEHDLDAIMARTLPTEITVYGRVEGARAQQELDTDLADLLEKLEANAGTAPADEQVEKDIPPPGKAKDQREEASGTNDYARLYEPNYKNLPKSSSPEASSAVEIAIEQMDNGNIDGSLEWFRRALNHDHADLQAMFGIAVTSGGVREQIAMLEHILKKQPNFKAAKVLLSNLLSETPGATPPVAVEQPPHPNAPYIEIAKLMQDPTPENQRRARELAEALTTKNENDAEAWYLRAILIRGKDKGAIDVKKRHLKRALRADPQHQLAKDELDKLTSTSSTTQTQERAPITRHPLLSRIEEVNLNKSALEVLEQVKESTDITEWIDRRMNKELIRRLLTTEDPGDSTLNDLKKTIEDKAEAYASYMEDEFDWPSNKHKENVRIIRDIMLNEIKLRVHQSQQESDQQTDSKPEKSKSDATYIDKLSQALLHSEAHLVITKEIEQAFIDGNIQVIEQYLATGKDILFVDSSTLPDYDSRNFDQVRAEGLKALYLQTLNGAIQNRAHKELLIAQLEKTELPEMLATVLMEDLRMLCPTAVAEADYHNHSARLSGATAKMEAIELLLKLTTRMFARKTGYLLDEGAPLAAAFLYLETVPHSSAPGSQVTELENQYREYIKTIRNALQIAEKKKSAGTAETPSTMKSEIAPSSIEDLVRIITEQQMLEEREILHLKEIAHTPEYLSDLNAIVTTMVDILEAKRTYKIIPEDTQFNRESLIMAIERIVIAHPTKNSEKSLSNIDELVLVIQKNKLLSDDDLFILKETLNEVPLVNGETGKTPALDLNLKMIAADIAPQILKLTGRETISQVDLITALKKIADTSEKPVLTSPETTLDLEATIQILNQLGYDKKIMTGRRGTYLNVPIKMVQQSIDVARRKKEIDENVRLDAATIKLALKEMARRHAEKQTKPAPVEETLMDLETTMRVLREHGDVTDTSLDMLLNSQNDTQMKKDIDFLITDYIVPALKRAKRDAKIAANLTFNHDTLAEALFELTKKRRSEKE